METSYPNTWLFGGVLDEFEWVAQSSMVRFWDGEEVEVRPGDVVTMLVTGGAVHFVEVWRAVEADA